MRNSNLIQLIKSLSEQDIRDLDKFLQSPYHNTRKILLRFFRVIKKYHPSMDSDRLKKEEVYRKLYPNQQYDDRNLRKQMSYLKSALEEFIIHQQLRKNDRIQQRLLIFYYYRFEQYDAFSRRVGKWIKQLQKSPLRDASFFLEMSGLNEIMTYHPDNRSSQQFQSGEMLGAIVQYLDLFFLLSKLRLETDFNTWSRIVNKKVPALIPFEKLENIVLDNTTDNILIDIYCRLYTFQQNSWVPNSHDFSELIEVFRENLDKMGAKERGFIFNTLTNICIAHVNDDEAFANLYTQLFQFGHKNCLILYEGKISPNNFLNVAIIGSGIGAFEWVNLFIDHYTENLTDSNRDLIVRLSRSSWFYHRSAAPETTADQKKKLLKKALNEIIVVPYEGYIYDLRIRSLQIRIYYDLYLPENSEKNRKVFLDYARAFRKYLKERDPLYRETAEPYMKFIEWIKKIARIRVTDQPNTKKIKDLLTLDAEILRDRKTALKAWLIKAVRELINSLT